MYSLLVSHLAKDLGIREVLIPQDRFLEYTGETFADQIKTLSLEAIAFLTAYPCVLMQEGRGEEIVQIVGLTHVLQGAGSIRLRFKPLTCSSKLNNAAIWRLRDELDIGQFEFNRNHLAVKEPDLFRVLAANGFAFDQSEKSAFQERPLPAPSRSALINARNKIAEWGHTEIDDFLLSAGVPGLIAGRDFGSRKDRADKIVNYVLENPGAKTAENSLLSAYTVRSAEATPSAGASPRPSPVATAFPAAKSADGTPNRVFVVHGQNENARNSVVSFLSDIGLESIVLHEQPNMGRHLLTKFIQEAELATFAVILMTDDDVGSLKGAELAPRARQNVILELGYFLSHLGQERICALIAPGLETPSDFDGIVYIRMDSGGKWQDELLRELKAARMPVSVNSRAV